MDASLVAEHLGDLGGVARARTLTARGVPRRALDAALERGVAVRQAQGWYALPGVRPELVVAARVRGALTCVTALDGYGLPLRARPAEAHIALATRRGAPRPERLPAGLRLHWSDGFGSGRVVAPVVALRHAARCLPLGELVAAMDAALARGLVEVADLAGERPRAGGATYRRAVALADPRSGSFQESLVRVALVESGLGVEPQVPVPGVGRVDLLVEGCVVVEADGYAYHSDRSAFREDRRRDRRLQLDGRPLLRYAFEDAVHGTAGLVREVRALVEEARLGWRAVRTNGAG